MEIESTLGVVETNSTAYVATLFAALEQGRTVVPLRTTDDLSRIKTASVTEVVTPDSQAGWFSGSLHCVADDAIAHIAFTSGTEGSPKGVAISRQSLVDVVTRVQGLMSITADVREYIGVPVYHSFGYGRCRHVATVGGQFYVPASGFDPREISSMLANDDINALSLVPSLLRVFLQNKELLGEERLRLRWLEIGSQAMTVDEKIAVRHLFPNARIVQHYGLTEASRSTLLQIDGADEAILGSVGKTYGDTEIFINDQGRICIKGRHVTSGLLRDGQWVDALDEHGWLVTTDLGRVVDGYLYFEGRADNVVNCAGQKLSTERLEQEILRVIEIDATAFAVSRIPHSIYGEGFLISFLKEEKLSELKGVAETCIENLGIKARHVVVMNPVSAIPKTHTGKVQHNVLVSDYLKQSESSRSTDGAGIKFAVAEVVGLSVSDIQSSHTLSDIGIDSIQSVQFSLKLERILGYLPVDWRQLSISQLENLPRKQYQQDSTESSVSKKGKAAPIWDGSSNMNPEGLGFWELVKEDYVTHHREFFSQGFIALFVHRFGNWRMGVRTKIFRAPMTLLYRVMIKFVQMFCGIKLDYTVHVGRRVKLEHFGGMILGARKIGDDVIIRQNTTFGIRDMTDLSAKPTLEQGVNIGAGVVIAGDITVGRYSVIGPNCVVTNDVPPFSVVSVAAPSVQSISESVKVS